MNQNICHGNLHSQSHHLTWPYALVMMSELNNRMLNIFGRDLTMEFIWTRMEDGLIQPSVSTNRELPLEWLLMVDTMLLSLDTGDGVFKDPFISKRFLG
jgi:hypothetical protein